MNEIVAKAALGQFLADDELEQLSARLATFNIFRALKVEDVEIRHSNTLAWLFDPAESHGLGDVFLRRILSNLLLESEFDVEGLSAAQVELMNFLDIELRREWKHTDVLVIDRKNELVLLIENKVHSSEGLRQLGRYLDAIQNEFPTFRVVPIFLTLEGKSSEDEKASKWINYSYVQLLHVLDRIVKQRRDQMPEAVAIFLSHYVYTLKRLTMQNKKLVDLCQKIYRKHREAIKLIVEYGEVSSFCQLASEIVGQAECEILKTYPKQFWFIPISWANVVPENGTAWPFLARKVSVACWMELWQNQINLKFEVCRMNDPELRMACVKALRENGFKLTKKAFSKDAVYSRFYRTPFRLIKDLGDEEEMRDAIERLVGKAKEEFPKVEAVLKGVFST